MSQKKLLIVTKKISQLSKFERKLFPIKNSKLIFDLLTVTTHYFLANKPLSIKQIYLTLGYSENGIRKQLKRLTTSKWLKIVKNPKDRRISYIVPTVKLINTFSKYSDYLENLFTEKS
jgi:DNA-binding MarR family transcriptional regulator